MKRMGWAGGLTFLWIVGWGTGLQWSCSNQPGPSAPVTVHLYEIATPTFTPSLAVSVTSAFPACATLGNPVTVAFTWWGNNGSNNLNFVVGFSANGVPSCADAWANSWACNATSDGVTQSSPLGTNAVSGAITEVVTAPASGPTGFIIVGLSQNCPTVEFTTTNFACSGMADAWAAFSYCVITATPTNTYTPTNTFTRTFTPTPTNSFTSTFTPTDTATFTDTFTPTDTNTPCGFPIATCTPTLTASFTPTSTPTPSFTSTPTPTFTLTFTNTPKYTATMTFTSTKTFTPTKTWTPGGSCGVPVTEVFNLPGFLVKGMAQTITIATSILGNPACGFVTYGCVPYHWQLGSLSSPPLGMVLNIDGTLTGTPSVDGHYVFNVCVVDAASNQNCQAVTVDVGEVSYASMSANITSQDFDATPSPITNHWQVNFAATVVGPVSMVWNPFMDHCPDVATSSWTSVGCAQVQRGAAQPMTTGLSATINNVAINKGAVPMSITSFYNILAIANYDSNVMNAIQTQVLSAVTLTGP